MDTLMLQGASLSEIARRERDFRYAGKAAPPKPNLTPREIWTDLITQTHQLLRQTDPPDFLARVTACMRPCCAGCRRRPTARCSTWCSRTASPSPSTRPAMRS